MVTILRELIPKGASNRPTTKLVPIEAGEYGATIHGTGNFNDGANAKMHSRYLLTQEARDRQVAYHGVIDEGVFIQTLPFDVIGWHAGDGCNDVRTDIGCFKTIGIEMCENVDNDFERTLTLFAEIIALMAIGDPRFDWGDGRAKGKVSIDRLYQHYWVAQGADKHDCPYKIRHLDRWNAFMLQIDAAWARLTGQTPAPPDPVLPEGMSLRLAKQLFGVYYDRLGSRYSFNPAGGRSKRWIRHGLATIPSGGTWIDGHWPNLENVFTEGSGKGAKYFQYSDGWVDDGKSKIG